MSADVQDAATHVWHSACADLSKYGQRSANLTFWHYSYSPQAPLNAVDGVLPHATQMTFEFFLGITPRWLQRDIHHESTAADMDAANDAAAAMIVGGGGLLVNVNPTSAQMTGLQWKVHDVHLDGMLPPFNVFGVGADAS